MNRLDWIYKIPWKALCVGTAEIALNQKSGTFDPQSTCGDEHWDEPLLLELHNGTYYEIRGLKQGGTENNALYAFEVVREIPKGEKLPGLEEEPEKRLHDMGIRIRKAA